MLIGYARVSRSEQDTALQLSALRKAGVRRILEEKASAVTTKREQLERLLEVLREGDTVVVYKLDRLARSVRDLLIIVDRIEAAGATFRSLTEAFDTTTSAGKMAFHMLGAVAEFERAIIIERSKAGIAAARAAGTRLGRPPSIDARTEAQIGRQFLTDKYSKRELARMHGVSPSTVKRALWRAGLDSAPPRP